MNTKKIIAIILITILFINLTLKIINIIDALTFWTIIIIGLIASYLFKRFDKNEPGKRNT